MNFYLSSRRLISSFIKFTHRASKISSVINIINHDLFYVGNRVEIAFEEGLTRVFFIVVLEIKDFRYPRLLYDLRAWKTRVQSCVQMTAFCSVDTHFDDGWLFCMEAQTLVEAFALIWVTSGASVFEARGQTSGGSVVSCWDHSVFLVDNDGANWAFHAIRSSAGDISDFHEILLPGRAERFDNLLFFELDLVFEEADSLAIANTSFDKLKTFFKLFIVFLIIFVDESFELFGSVVNLSFEDKVMVSLEGRGFN